VEPARASQERILVARVLDDRPRGSRAAAEQVGHDSELVVRVAPIDFS